MYITNKTDGIHILNHGVMSVSEMVQGTAVLDPSKLGQVLAKINRYAGNTIVPWNDAEHSMLVAALVHHVGEFTDIDASFLTRPTVVDSVKLLGFIKSDERRTDMIMSMAHYWGMLHDVVECVVGDTPNPVKKFEEGTIQRSGATAEDVIVQQLKVQQLGDYALALAEQFTGSGPFDPSPLNRKVRHLTANLILDLLQDFVKPADKLALLIEMNYMHNTSVLDYVRRLWDVNGHTMDFVKRFKWERLGQQTGYEGIDWRNSARRWEIRLQEDKKRLKELFLQ